MKKIYVNVLSNKEGKDIFNGESKRSIVVNKIIYNLVGCVNDYNLNEQVIICSAKTQKELYYGTIKELDVVNNDTLGKFMVLD